MFFRKQTGIEDFETAALPHLDDLFRTSRGVLSSEAEAAYIVGKTYLRAWKSTHRLKPESVCRAWLFQVLFQVIHRHRGKVLGFESTFREKEQIASGFTDQKILPEQLEDGDFIAAFNRLPPANRATLHLVDVEEFSYRETSDLLGIPIETVRSLLGRGRAILCQELILQASHPGNLRDGKSQLSRIF